MSLERSRWRRAGQRGKDSRRWEEALASQARLAGARDPKQDERYTVSGEAREPRTPPRGALGRLSGPESRWPGPRGAWSGRWGTAVPGPHGREGAAGQHVLLEGPLGEPPGAPTVARQRQKMADQAKRSPERGCNKVVHVSAPACVLAASRQTRKSRAPGGEQGTATP